VPRIDRLPTSSMTAKSVPEGDHDTIWIFLAVVCDGGLISYVLLGDNLQDWPLKDSNFEMERFVVLVWSE
jgi:hypothetical protein